MKDNIILIGFMGSGKSTLGKLLADRLEMNFIDTDQWIETEEGRSIAEIFKQDGEEYFRLLEHNFLKNNRLHNTVLSTGGGMPCFNDNMSLLQNMGKTCYLKVSWEVLKDRLVNDFSKRPKIDTEQEEIFDAKLEQLLTDRYGIYQTCDFVLVNEGDVDKKVQELIAWFGDK